MALIRIPGGSGGGREAAAGARDPAGDDGAGLSARLSEPPRVLVGSRAMMQEPEAARPLRKGAATLALRRRLTALRPELEVSPSGYVARIEDNLVPGVEPRHFVEDLARGDGNELESKFRAVHSSAALVVNTFDRFKDEPAHLTLAGVSGFETLTFERACPTGLRGKAPNLDLVAQGPAGVVAVESKLTEPLQPTAPCFSPRYAERIWDERRAGVWFRAMETVRAQPDSFSSLDVAQLIKHAFGLARCFKGQRTTLLYLYWEPQDADRAADILAHRREIERFARMVTDGFPEFRAQSYRELWAEWQQGAGPSWLKDHVGNLQERYGVMIGAGAEA